MYSGAGHKSTPVFILTEEQSRRVDKTAVFWVQLSGREIDMKRANYLLSVYNGLKPHSTAGICKSPLPSYSPIKSTGAAIDCCAYCCSTGHQCSCTAGLGPCSKTKVSSVCRYLTPTTGRLASFGADPYKGAHQDRSSYSVARETRTLFNRSLHYPLFLRGVKKPTLLSRRPV